MTRWQHRAEIRHNTAVSEGVGRNRVHVAHVATVEPRHNAGHAENCPRHTHVAAAL